MADTIRLELKLKDFQRAVRRLQSRAKPAIARSLNRSGVTTRTFMARKIAGDLRLKVNDIKAEIVVRDADVNKLRVLIIVKGAKLSLMKFAAKGPIPSRGKGTGVRVNVGPPGKRHHPHAFIARTKIQTDGSGGEALAVFERKGKTRLPIKKLHGPSLPAVFSKYQADGMKAGEASLVKNLKHEFKWALSQTA